MATIQHPEHDAFVRAIAATPHDSLLYRMYSDWLEEKGHDKEAQALRFVLEHQRDPGKIDARVIEARPDSMLGPGTHILKIGAPAIRLTSPEFHVFLQHHDPTDKLIEQYMANRGGHLGRYESETRDDAASRGPEFAEAWDKRSDAIHHLARHHELFGNPEVAEALHKRGGMYFGYDPYRSAGAAAVSDGSHSDKVIVPGRTHTIFGNPRMTDGPDVMLAAYSPSVPLPEERSPAAQAAAKILAHLGMDASLLKHRVPEGITGVEKKPARKKLPPDIFTRAIRSQRASNPAKYNKPPDLLTEEQLAKIHELHNDGHVPLAIGLHLDLPVHHVKRVLGLKAKSLVGEQAKYAAHLAALGHTHDAITLQLADKFGTKVPKRLKLAAKVGRESLPPPNTGARIVTQGTGATHAPTRTGRPVYRVDSSGIAQPLLLLLRPPTLS